MSLFEGKTVLVSGGASGIGKAMARAFCEEGGTVLIADRQEATGRSLAHELKAAGRDAWFYACDVGKGDSVRRLMDEVGRDHEKIDALCNNAGVELSASIEDTMEEDWDRVFNVNVKGMYLLTRFCLPFLKRGAHPAIVNTASISGLIGWPDSSAYCASKGAVVMLTKELAVELGPFGVRVNCICPGTTTTPMIDRLIGDSGDREKVEAEIRGRHLLGRFARPEEVAAAAVFLASSEASFITGAILPVDGGYTAK